MLMLVIMIATFTLRMDYGPEFWEILSNLKLTHLTADFEEENCDIYRQKLLQLFQKCSHLQVLELTSCLLCETTNNSPSLFQSYFPSLLYFRLDDCGCYFSLEDIVSRCTGLNLLKYCCEEIMYFSSTCVSSHNLQQLCIEVEFSRITETFMDTISAHGELTRVVLFVKSNTAEGISALVKNSRNW